MIFLLLLLNREISWIKSAKFNMKVQVEIVFLTITETP